MMDENLEQLKQQLPLLDYLRRRQWRARRAGQQQEFVGLCPFHRETKPSFYVNARKNLFYCHGCGRGGDLIRWIQLSRGLSFRESVEHLKRELGQTADLPTELLEQTTAFYQCQLHRHAEAAHYLAQRGLRDPDVIAQLRVHGKGNKQRILPLPPDTIRALENYLHLERPLTNSPRLFVSLKGPRRGQSMTPAGLRSLFRHHRRQSKVVQANPHRFRHTFGADMVRAGISLPALMRLMGHAHIHTTMLYVQLSPQDVWNEFHRAVENRTRLHPPQQS